MNEFPLDDKLKKKDNFFYCTPYIIDHAKTPEVHAFNVEKFSTFVKSKKTLNNSDNNIYWFQKKVNKNLGQGYLSKEKIEEIILIKQIKK